MVIGTKVPGEYRGRPPGIANKRTRELEAKVKSAQALAEDYLNERFEDLDERAFKWDAHTWLCVLYKDPRQPVEIRMDAAKAALPYEKPKLAAIAIKQETELTLQDLIMQTIDGVKSKEIEHIVNERNEDD